MNYSQQPYNWADLQWSLGKTLAKHWQNRYFAELRISSFVATKTSLTYQVKVCPESISDSVSLCRTWSSFRLDFAGAVMKSTNICSNRNLVASVGFQCEGLVTGDIDLGRLKNRAARGTRVSFWSNLLWLCADHWLLINIILYIYIMGRLRNGLQ